MTSTDRTEGASPAPALSAPPEAARLRGHLKLPGAIALAITIVVGSGALVLPGIAYQEAGNAALYGWLLAAAITVPLLVLFARLGAAYPGAGGIAGFVQAAFGRRLAGGVELLVIGTFSLGMPGIALTGAGYLTVLPGMSELPQAGAAALLVIVAAAVVHTGIRLSTGVQIVLATVLTVGLLAAGTLAVLNASPTAHLPAADVSDVTSGAQVVGAVFFAFTGWEMLSFTTEEYAHPRRDFPRAVVLSFFIVTTMYLLLALGVQSLLRRQDDATVNAPVQAVVKQVVSPEAGTLVALLGVVIILANLVGALWGASRLVMSSAREGLLPSPLARLHRGENPRTAVLACAAVFLAVIASSAIGWSDLGSLLAVAGKNFFLLYLLCALAYTRLFRGAHRILGAGFTAVLAVVAVALFGPAQLVYAAGLLLLGTVLAAYRARQKPTSA